MSKREINLPEDTLECWCQVSPVGEFEAEQDGKPVVQLCDMEAFGRLVAAFDAPVLVDFEHRSEEGDDTTAAGWAQELRRSSEEGLEARVVWTDIGADDLRHKRRRYLSGVWRCGEDRRPVKLRSIALTNRPNMPNRPVLNKSAANQSGEPMVGAPQPKEIKTMKELAALYGLPETASEADILAAAKADRDKLAALQKQVDEMAKANLEAEAEQVAADNEDVIANKEQFKQLFVANKALAEKFLACLPKADSKSVCNKAAARMPSFARAARDPAACKNKYQIWRDMPEGAGKDAYLDANADEINDGAPTD